MISRHALTRAVERIPGITTEDQARTLITEALTKSRAIEFGAKYVKLGTGHRLVMEGSNVVTVLDRDHSIFALSRLAEVRRIERKALA